MKNQREQFRDLYEKATKPATSEKIPRNNPCPCHSGRKFKQCCINGVRLASLPELPKKLDKDLKGIKNGNCNRSACQKPNAVYFNHSTEKYYCHACAVLINDANRADSIRLFGHELCTLQS
jgi:hypothetical protein